MGRNCAAAAPPVGQGLNTGACYNPTTGSIYADPAQPGVQIDCRL